MIGRDRTYLIHIRDAIASIRDYTSGGEPAFMSSRLHQDAVMRNFEIVGEAGGRLSKDLRDNSPVAWQEIKAFRNFLAHQYMDVRPAMVWRIIANDLPALEAHVLRLLSES